MELIKKLSNLYVISMHDLGVELKHSEETLVSGFCYMIFIISSGRFCENRNWNNIITRAMLYAALYLNIDYYIDSPEVSLDDKKNFLRWLSNWRQNACHLDCPVRRKCFDLLDKLNIEQKYFDMLMAMVVDSHDVQCKADLKVSEYLDVCRMKGGLTMLAGIKIVYSDATVLVSDNMLIELGYCLQLLDDIADCLIDIKDNINTPCTVEYSRRGNIDRIVLEAVTRANHLQVSKLRLHKKIYMHCLMTCVEGNNYISDELRSRLNLKPFAPLDKTPWILTEEYLRKLWDFMDNNA